MPTPFLCGYIIHRGTVCFGAENACELKIVHTSLNGSQGSYRYAVCVCVCVCVHTHTLTCLDESSGLIVAAFLEMQRSYYRSIILVQRSPPGKLPDWKLRSF